MLKSLKPDFLFEEDSGSSLDISAFDLIKFAKNKGGSVEEFVLIHTKRIEKNTALKALFTKDERTIEIADKILQNNAFLKSNIMHSREGESSNQLKSQAVKINDIKNSQYFTQFKAQRGKKALAFIGGPAAEDGAVMAALIPDLQNKVDEIFYIIDDYRKSNVSSSAKQLHARHAVPLNAEECLTGHALIPVLFKRIVQGISLEKVIKAHYIKVDINYKNLFRNLGIYLKNEIDWIRKTLEEKRKKLTDNDWGRIESLLTISLLQITEQLSKRKITEFQGENNKSYSIHLTFSKEEDEGLKKENENFKRAGIFAQELPRHEIDKIFGKNKSIISAFYYPSDSNILFDAHETNRQISEAVGVKWLSGATLKQVFLESRNDEAQLAGIEIEQNGELKFLRMTQMHTTLGYRAEYVFADNRFKTDEREIIAAIFNRDKEEYLVKKYRRQVNKIKDALGFGKIDTQFTTASGMSMNLILKKTSDVRNLMETFGNTTGQLAVTNSHWTMVAQDEEHIILRVTGGGFTGSEEYKSAYFLNTFVNTIRIFGFDAIEGVISTYACPRAIDPDNATRWLQPARGWVISYGKGGTGNSERSAEAAFAAMFLGFNKEVVKFYNQFQTSDKKAVGDFIQRVFNHVIYDGRIHFKNIVEEVSCKMGYANSGLGAIIEDGLIIVSDLLRLFKKVATTPQRWSYHLLSIVKMKGRMPVVILDEKAALNFEIANNNNYANNNEHQISREVVEKKESL